MDLSGLSREPADAAKSTISGKIKDFVGMPQSPNYGAGEQKRFFEHQ